MKKAWNTLSPILFWASLWGIFEATAGCILHLLPIKLGWMFWFPIAFYCMNKVYNKTKKPWCVLITAVISASIKLIDLIFPVRIDMVLNPAVSILLESLFLSAFYIAGKRFSQVTENKAVFALGTNTAWRLMYLLYILFMPQWMIEISPLRSTEALLKFLVYQNCMTSMLLYLYLKFGNTIKTFVMERAKQIKPINQFRLPMPYAQTFIVVFLLSLDILLAFIL